MPPSLTSGSSIIVSVQNTDVDIGLRYGPKSSALPIVPQSASRGARFSRLRWFATATACQVAGPPVRIRLGRPANGGFYFQAFDRSVALPVAGYNYNSVWTPLLAGLSPAGMAASVAALVRPCGARGFLELADAVLHQCIRPLLGARLCSGPSWISARMRSHYRLGLDRAVRVTSVRMRREDRSSIVVSTSRRPRRAN